MKSSPVNSRKTAVRLMRHIAAYRGVLIFSILCMAGFNIFSAAPPFYAKDIVDSLAYGENPTLDKFFIVGFGIVVIFTFKGLFFYGHNYGMGLIIQRLLREFRHKLFDHIQHLPLNFFAKSKTGDLVSRFTNDLQVLQHTMNVAIAGPFRDIPQIFILLGIMIYRSWQLTLVTMVIIPVALFCIQRFGRRNKLAVSQRQESFGDLASILVETITGIRVVKAFGMEKYEVERFDEANQLLYDNNMRTTRITAYSTPIVEVIGATAGATMVAYGGYLIIDQQITAGDFASFFLSFFMLNDPVKKLNGFNLKLQEGLAAVHRVFGIMDAPAEVYSHPGATPIKSFEREIKLDIKRFKYEGAEETILQDLQITVPKGQILAIVGSSGSGKSTLVNLIPRFYDVDEGSIKIDGRNIRDLELNSLRKLMSVVTQETVLFNDTIANNISYGHPECPKSKLDEAARAANAYDFIHSLSQGYNTVIGEKGVRLSGGQRQRLAIARALIKDAPILILDEATSALDNESEIEVQQAIDHLMQNRTSFVIAHRLSTVRNAHRIMVLEGGKIVQLGTHEELVAQNGRYQELYRMQFRD